MKEFQEIINIYDAAKKQNINSALVTVVHLGGSSYRRPGARMLVNENGRLTGSISGGCLEGDAQKKALFVLNEKSNSLISYDTSDENDAEVGVQLGCEGIIQVLIETIDAANENNPINLLRKAISKRQNAVLVTLFDLNNKKDFQAGTCVLLEQDGNISGNIPLKHFEEAILKDMTQAMQNGESAFKQYKFEDKTVTAFFEFLQPAVSLVVLGGGNDALPLMKFADILGWDFKIIDRRETHATQARFETASQVLLSTPDICLNHMAIDSRTFVVLVTHSYQCDLQMIKSLHDHEVSVPYIGVLGPKKKLNKILDDLRIAGYNLNEDQLATIYGPTGLDIGAETAEEIALSIVAEIQAVLAKKNGGMLKKKTEVIHSRSSLDIALSQIEIDAL